MEKFPSPCRKNQDYRIKATEIFPDFQIDVKSACDWKGLSMPYILRDASGGISRISVRPLVGGETLPHHNPEVLGFLISRHQDPQQIVDALAQLQASDGEMARAIEDLIIILLKKNVLKMSELPRPVQDRMAHRTKLRAKIEETYEKASSKAHEKEHAPRPIEPKQAATDAAPVPGVAGAATHAVA
jgi:hypothetical protein